jgi:arylsulfatase A-like enzyme
VVRSTVPTTVSQLDLFSTILDYLGAPSSLDRSDGSSLRRHIENTSYNKWYDESVVVAEDDNRIPRTATKMTKADKYPSIAIRRGKYKLITFQSAESTSIDMLYNLEQDPYVLEGISGDF